MPAREDYEVDEIPDFTLECGATLRPARVAYKTFGELDADRQRDRLPDLVLGPPLGQRVADRRGHGPRPRASTSSSSRTCSATGSRARRATRRRRTTGRASRDVTFYDQVESQHRLVTEHFGIETLPLVTGWSMGAGQTYQWAVSHPEMVAAARPFCGSSQTSAHNFVFLEGVKAALTADAAFKGGWYDDAAGTGLRAAAASTPAGGSRRRSTGTRCYKSMGHTLARGLPRRVLGGPLPRPP